MQKSAKHDGTVVPNVASLPAWEKSISGFWPEIFEKYPKNGFGQITKITLDNLCYGCGWTSQPQNLREIRCQILWPFLAGNCAESPYPEGPARHLDASRQ